LVEQCGTLLPYDLFGREFILVVMSYPKAIFVVAATLLIGVAGAVSSNILQQQAQGLTVGAKAGLCVNGHIVGACAHASASASTGGGGHKGSGATVIVCDHVGASTSGLIKKSANVGGCHRVTVR
jgi:hypothetical protein